MPLVVRLRPETFTQPACRARLAATAAIHELVLVGVRPVLPVDAIAQLSGMLAPRRVVLVDGGRPAGERAQIEELLNDGLIPVVLTRCDPPPSNLTGWLGTVSQDAAPVTPPASSSRR